MSTYYTYKTVSTYNTVRGVESRGPTIKPFVPFVPGSASSGNSDGYVTKKTIVPVSTSRPHDDDAYRDGAAAGGYKKPSYPPTKKTIVPFSTGPYDGDHRDDDGGGYKKPSYPSEPNYVAVVRGNDEWPRKKSPVRSTEDEFITKVRNNAIQSPRLGSVAAPIDGRQSPTLPTHGGPYGGHNSGTNGYGGHGYGNNFGVGHGGDYGGKYGGDKEGRKSSGMIHPNNGYGVSPAWNGNDANNGYGGRYGSNHSDKERHSPTRSVIPNKSSYDYDDGANNNNGYGGGYPNNKGPRPVPQTGSYGYNGGNGYDGGYNTNNNQKSSIVPGSTAWTARPRNGTQVTTPTSDIDKAMELLKEAAANESSNNNNKGVIVERPSNNWASSLANEGKGRDAAAPRYGNFNFSSARPRTPPSHVTFVDGDDDQDYHHWNGIRNHGNASPVDSRYAEIKYAGARV